MTVPLLGPDGREIGTAEITRDDVEGFVEDFERVLTETERRYRLTKPPQRSSRAKRHARDNAAARRKKRLRKQSRR